MKRKITKIVLIVVLVLLICIIGLVLIINNTRLFKIQNKQGEALETEQFTVEIKAADANYIYYLLKFTDVENGIKKIVYPDGTEIYPNNRTTVALDYAVNPANDYDFLVVNGAGDEVVRKIEKMTYTGGILQELRNVNESGITKIDLKVSTEKLIYREVGYNINAIIYNGDLVLDGETQVDGATLTEETKTIGEETIIQKIYEFGNSNQDVATASIDAQNTVVLKVNGNLTINENVKLTSCKSDSGFGGPKGMIVYCTGTLTNNGTISMTARGGRARGEDVFLWKNIPQSYEYVPAYGATGTGGNGGGWNGGGATGSSFSRRFWWRWIPRNL